MPDTSQVRQVLADPNFYALPIGERTKVISQLDPNFATLPADEQTRVVTRGVQPSPTPAVTQFEQDRTPQGSAFERFTNAVKETLPSWPSIARRAAFLGLDPVSDYNTVRGILTSKSGTDLASAATGIDIPAMQQRAEHGDTAGILGQVALPTAAVVAPLAARGVGATGRAVGRTIAPVDAAGVAKPGPLSRLVLGDARAKALGELLNPDASRNAVYEQRAQDLMQRGTEQDALDARQATAHRDFTNQVTAIEDARQKELADWEKFREQDAQSRMQRQTRQDMMDRRQMLADRQAAKNLSIPDAATSGSPSGTPSPLPAPAVSASSSTGPQMDMSALAAKRGRLSASQPTRPAPVIVTPDTPLDSEGRPATWTNERVQELSGQGGTLTSRAVVQGVKRQLDLPDNATMVANPEATAPPSFGAPKSVTLFDVNGNPIPEDIAPPTMPPIPQSSGPMTLPPLFPELLRRTNVVRPKS